MSKILTILDDICVTENLKQSDIKLYNTIYSDKFANNYIIINTYMYICPIGLIILILTKVFITKPNCLMLDAELQ